ncbi:filamentous hemagglutinin N-terminal domain-containing protein [Nostoc sp. UHCC 0252]|uniref:beta strand repeat-containing protein n=1 Tax=Nostoc sp. UHCC 0252 TaxID=3110241 RepID=UPI002B1FAC75|nr:filamentous hemagglutinin N-terminal domain-containing protein [Nostoc sp. UHCC 0252]MEA5602782.1 filamentous hemagglutinin N-terminal domain-containing protein [Nostoc sp. UHCC 0252]
MNKVHHIQIARIQSILYYLCLISTISSHSPAKAQIAPDNTLGAEASQLNENLLINGGAKRESNLFHSFSEFNIQDGQRVYFANPTGVENILARVTGRNASNIFGTLGVDGAANLFLINPNGIVFGENAQLDVQGSFVSTTANGVQFGNQGNFSATNPQAPSLLTVNPSALFFNQINQGAAIQNNSLASAGIDPAGFDTFGLRVGDGKSLLLVGGNVNMNRGWLNAYSGRVELGGLAEPGNINLVLDGDHLSLKFPENVTRADVSLINNASVYVEGAGGGNIAINARNIEILDRSGLNAGIGVSLGQPETIAGDIILNGTGEIKIAGSESKVVNLVHQEAKGSGGNITIDSGSFLLQDGAMLSASTFGQGNAGNVTVSAKNGVSIANANIFSTVEAGGVGKGGNININAATLLLTDSAQLQTSTSGASDTQTAGRGDAGNVNIKVAGTVDIAGGKNGFVSAINSFVEPGTVGNGGNITIDAGDFSLRDGAQLSASTLGEGNAGNVTVSAANSITLANQASILSAVEAGGVGDGGNINIDAATLSLIDGAQLSASTLGKGNAGNVTVSATNSITLANKASILSAVEAEGVGDGGNINIDAATLSLTDGAQLVASTSGQGNAGNVTVNARNAVLLADSGIFSTVQAGGVGKGGDINIDAATLSLTDGAQLRTITAKTSDTQPAGRGDAGNVNIKVTGTVDIAGEKNDSFSAINSFADVGTVGNGGNITIDAGDFSLRDRAVMSASTFGQGNAGNVTVSAKNSITIANAAILSRVSAGGVGKGGDININGATLSLTDGAQLQTSTSGALDSQPAGRGDAGNVNVKVTGSVDIIGQKNGFSSSINSFVDVGTVGNGGNITIDAGDFSLRDRAVLSASTFGQGDAGNVTVSAKNSITIADAAIFSRVSAGGVGKGGDININAATLSLIDGAQLQTATSGALDTQPPGRGDAGNVNINVTGAVDIAGDKNGFFSSISSFADVGTVGNGGNITINSGNFSLRDGALLSASTYGQGNAGNIHIYAKNTLTVSGTGQRTGFSSGLFTFTNSNSIGRGGNITLNTNIFHISNGALLDARTRNNQDGGDITINTNIFKALNGGQLTTTTSNDGRAGKITVNAGEEVIIDGSDLDFENRLRNFPNTVVNIGADSGLFVSSTGSGITGDIEINSPKITIDNQGKLNAESASSNGGNIKVDSDLLLLRRGAQISTSATTDKLDGNGGNISINSRFIVAVPNENSNISANAFRGKGGNIKINSQGIFGIQSRTELTQKNDITTSSELGVSGATNINAPDNSSIQNSFTGLSQNAIDTNVLIANSCISRGIKQQENSFTIIGSGALPANRPGALVSRYATGEVRGVEITSRPWKKGDPIIEPQGLYRLSNGQLILSRSC